MDGHMPHTDIIRGLQCTAVSDGPSMGSMKARRWSHEGKEDDERAEGNHEPRAMKTLDKLCIQYIRYNPSHPTLPSEYHSMALQ